MMKKHLHIILEKMCKSVGAKLDDIDIKKENWYHDHEWSEKKQSNFINWLSDYLYENTEARRELMSFPQKSKRMCNNVAKMFVFNYGWKTKEK